MGSFRLLVTSEQPVRRPYPAPRRSHRSLDAENQQAIAAAIDTLRHEKTIIVIAHQLSTITTADEILFLEDGNIAERGTHEELLTMNQRYAAHWRALTAARTWRLIDQ